ncbi:MAG: hypothetical protein ACYCX2_06895 [Christensenellales bacterium]
MNRSVYSLVLMDRVVEAIDRLALKNNTSRSALINKVLAEYVSCITPEQRTQDIFAQMRRIIMEVEALQILPQVSDLQIGMRSALQYRYNPIIQYSVALYRNLQPYFGVLRITSRTQSKPLMDALSSFFTLWTEVEGKLSGLHFKTISFKEEPGRYTRELRYPEEVAGLTNEMLAEAISRYIQVFDSALKLFLVNGEPYETARRKTEEIYTDHLAGQNFII